MLNILIPLAGESTFITSKSHAFPKILHDIGGKLLIERAAAPFVNLEQDKKIVIAVPKKQTVIYKLDKVLGLLDDSVEICEVNSDTRGAACSALLAIESLELDSPLVVSSFEQVLDVNLSNYLQEFVRKDAKAGVLTFESIHPKWSYVKSDAKGVVTQAAEKIPISNRAIAGLYYFKTARLFVESVKDMIRKDVTHNGTFYISNALNEVILNDGLVYAIPIDGSTYFHISDEHALDVYEQEIAKNGMGLMSKISARSQEYIKAFDSKDIGCIANLFSDEFLLKDPSVNLRGRNSAVAYVRELFNSADQLRFSEIRTLVDGKRSVIEFELEIDGCHYLGTDVILWSDDYKMVSMDAYLYETK